MKNKPEEISSIPIIILVEVTTSCVPAAVPSVIYSLNSTSSLFTINAVDKLDNSTKPTN